MHILLLALTLLSADSTTLTGRVVSISDGDTCTVLIDGRQVKVRLAGIDAPEKKQPFGDKARERLGELCHGRDVKIVTAGQDRYGRTLGTIYVDGVDVNRQLLEEGLCWHYKQFDRSVELAAAEIDAHEAKRGLWVGPKPVAPWEWRKRR